MSLVSLPTKVIHADQTEKKCHGLQNRINSVQGLKKECARDSYFWDIGKVLKRSYSRRRRKRIKGTRRRQEQTMELSGILADSIFLLDRIAR